MDKTIEIFVNGEEVEYLFDKNKSETFDPIDAVAYMPYGGPIYKVQDFHKVTVSYGDEYEEDECGEEVEDDE